MTLASIAPVKRCTGHARWLALMLLAGCVRHPADPLPATPVTASGRSPGVVDVHIDTRLMSGCDVAAAPAVFTVDISFIKPPEASTLVRLARCLTRGPLQGRRIRVVEEAALLWPDRDSPAVDALHAYAVRDYLVFHGVARDAIDVASKRSPFAGDGDAQASRFERRVDVHLLP